MDVRHSSVSSALKAFHEAKGSRTGQPESRWCEEGPKKVPAGGARAALMLPWCCCFIGTQQRCQLKGKPQSHLLIFFSSLTCAGVSLVLPQSKNMRVRLMWYYKLCGGVKGCFVSVWLPTCRGNRAFALWKLQDASSWHLWPWTQKKAVMENDWIDFHLDISFSVNFLL